MVPVLYCIRVLPPEINDDFVLPILIGFMFVFPRSEIPNFVKNMAVPFPT